MMDIQTALFMFILAVVVVGAGWFIYDANR
jgi:hypothetical protein